MKVFKPGDMFPKLNLHDREVFKKQTISQHDATSFMFDKFDRRFGINTYIGYKEIFGVSSHEWLVSKKYDLIDTEAYYAGKAV